MIVSAISGGWAIMAFMNPLPVWRIAKKIAAKTTPTGAQLASSATAMPVEALGGHDADAHVGEVAAVEGEPRQPGKRARDDHREHRVLLDVDAAVFGREAVEADRFHLIAEHRPVEDEDDQRGGDDRDEDAEVEVGALGQQGDRLGFQRSGRPG